jgi:spermidine synthase
VAGAIDREQFGISSRLTFIITIFVGSFLLFLMQPMVARMALPRVGGAPAVWNSAMLVYQALLLAGYAYAHWIGRATVRRQAIVHLTLLAIAAATLPIGLIAGEPSPETNVFLWVPWLLIISIGPLFFVISAQAPLIQRWYAVAAERDPYPLYAASNLGSFAGLLCYPLAVEPLMAMRQQRLLWSAGYVLLAMLVARCALRELRVTTSSGGAAQEAMLPGWRERTYWIVLAAVPSGLILSTTLHLTTDIGAMPLLWVIPLGLYLLSFAIAFSSRRWPARAIIRTAPITLIAASCCLFLDFSSLAIESAVVALLNLFAISVALHSQLFERRPHSSNLTIFYLILALGGVIGGTFCALIAPLTFDWAYEHPLLLAAAAFLIRSPSPFEPIARIWTGDQTSRRLTIVGIPLVFALALLGKGFLGLESSSTIVTYAFFAILAVALFAIGNRALFTASILALMLIAGGWDRVELSATPGALTRSYFGIYSVRPDGRDARMLIHGTTLHGVQDLGTPERERIETTYYAPLSGVGLAMQVLPQLFGNHPRIDVVGLGAGTLACYAKPGERWTFYEIDPAVVRIARNPKQFTFLSICLPNVPIILGDARLTLGRAPARGADLLVVDAFSSDAIPVHLLTREAFNVYRRRLVPSGLLLIHITNRFLDLEPVLSAEAAAGGWHAVKLAYSPSAAGRRLHEAGSLWIALSPSSDAIGRLTNDGAGWTALKSSPGFTAWSDDYASVFPLFRW